VLYLTVAWGEGALLKWPGAVAALIEERDAYMARVVAAAAAQGSNPNVPAYVADQVGYVILHCCWVVWVGNMGCLLLHSSDTTASYNRRVRSSSSSGLLSSMVTAVGLCAQQGSC
jgi:hypothetical protein